uniref:Uncharacterized protein n=1 Tax=Anguilla anguilla TaxID=7936 RepID=A0A0E9S3B6_ANGAN
MRAQHWVPSWMTLLISRRSDCPRRCS